MNYWAAARVFSAEVDMAAVFLIVPSIVLIGMLPISIGGWGLQEFGAAIVFDSTGLTAALGLSAAIILRVKNIVVGLIGALLLLLPEKFNTSNKGRLDSIKQPVDFE